MRVYYIRHGETDWNRALLLQGGTDVPLNENGRAAAVLTGKGLSEVRFDLCITSPLGRTMETAELILRKNSASAPDGDPGLWPAGTPTERNGVRFFTDERLREYCFGVWEGLCYKGPEKNLPIENYADFWSNPDDRTRPEGAESLTGFFGRVADFLRELGERYGESARNILVVAHGGVSRAVRNALDGGTKSMENCEAMILEWTEENGLQITGRQKFLPPEA